MNSDIINVQHMRSVYEKNLQSRHCETVTDKYRDRDIVEKPKQLTSCRD